LDIAVFGFRICFGFRVSSFEFASDFGIRVSSFPHVISMKTDWKGIFAFEQ